MFVNFKCTLARLPALNHMNGRNWPTYGFAHVQIRDQADQDQFQLIWPSNQCLTPLFHSVKLRNVIGGPKHQFMSILYGIISKISGYNSVKVLKKTVFAKTVFATDYSFTCLLQFICQSVVCCSL
jgi:hypothetical protein